MSNPIVVKAGDGDAKARIDRFASEQSGITRSQVHKMIEGGLVLVNGAAIKPNYKIRPGDEISITPLTPPTRELEAEDIPLTFILKDEHIVAVDKPAGLVVHPAEGNMTGTLMNGLRHALGELRAMGAPLRPGVVHRLDKDTSGVMVVALTDQAYYGMVEQFSERSVKKTYLVLLDGRVKDEYGTINQPIGRSYTDRKKMSTRTRHGREAETSWEVVERFGSAATLVRARMGTGRTHQIRVHFASIGHPVLGDITYGRKTTVRVSTNNLIKLPRQMLHARKLGFKHPVTGEDMRLKSPLPEDFQAALEKLRAACPEPEQEQ